MHKQYKHLIPIFILTFWVAQLQANEKLFSHKDAYKILYYGDSASRTELAQSRPFTFTGFKVVAVIAQAEKLKMAQLRTVLGTRRRINKEASKAQVKAGNVEIYINKSSYGEYHIYNQDRSISACIHIQITISPDSKSSLDLDDGRTQPQNEAEASEPPSILCAKAAAKEAKETRHKKRQIRRKKIH